MNLFEHLMKENRKRTKQENKVPQKKVTESTKLLSNYSPDELTDLVNEYYWEYSPETHERIWNEIMDRFEDEALANDVLASLEDNYHNGLICEDDLDECNLNESEDNVIRKIESNESLSLAEAQNPHMDNRIEIEPNVSYIHAPDRKGRLLGNVVLATGYDSITLYAAYFKKFGDPNSQYQFAVLQSDPTVSRAVLFKAKTIDELERKIEAKKKDPKHLFYRYANSEKGTFNSDWKSKLKDLIPQIEAYDKTASQGLGESLSEDTVKKSNGKWANRGDDGTEHGEFDTKKKADAQRKAMYANGYKGESKEVVKESNSSNEILDMAQMSFETGQRFRPDDFDSKREYNEYSSYMELGPSGFYEEYKDILDFDPDFASEYGYLDESKEVVKESYDPLEIGKEYIFKSILTPEDEITDSEYAFLADYSGKKCTIVAYAEDADPDLWTVEFEDGAVADVFGDELTPVIEECDKVIKESHDYDESSEDDRKLYEKARYSLNDLLDEFGVPLDYVVQVGRYGDTIKNIVYLVKSYYDGLNESIEYPDFVVKVSPGTDSRRRSGVLFCIS